MVRFTLFAKDAAQREFEVTGQIEGESPMDPEAYSRACEAAFLMITNGRAYYGHPGVDGCKGPYEVISFSLTKAAR
jgi:hypothetical protein